MPELPEPPIHQLNEMERFAKMLKDDRLPDLNHVKAQSDISQIVLESLINQTADDDYEEYGKLNSRLKEVEKEISELPQPRPLTPVNEQKKPYPEDQELSPILPLPQQVNIPQEVPFTDPKPRKSERLQPYPMIDIDTVPLNHKCFRFREIHT